MNLRKDILWRVLLSMSLLALFGAMVVYFIFRIQFIEGAKWRALSDSLTVKTREIPAVRGSIYADHSELLATSLPIYKVSLDMQVIASRHRDSFSRYIPYLAKSMSQSFGNRSDADFERILRRGYNNRDRYLLLTRNASFINIKEMQTWPILKHGRYKAGVIIEERTVRKKPYGPLLQRTIGFVNENGRGAGIEATYNEELAGVNGRILVQRISGGYRPLNDELAIEPKDGQDVFTTFNVELQDIVHNALLKMVEKQQAKFGTAILMEVKTGKIKAMSNLTRSENGYIESFNHAVGTLYEPGSTAKLLSSIALLKDDKIQPDDSVDIEWGRVKFYDRWIEDSDKGEFKNMSFRQIFERSSNVGTSKSVYKAYKDDPKKFIRHLDALRLNKQIPIGIRGAGVPNMLRPDEPGWSGTALPSLSIGYSMQLTPLHVLMVYNAIANNGAMVKPYLIKGVGSFGKMEQEFGTTVLNKSIAPPSVVSTLQEFLEGVVQRGTARNLKNVGFGIAGKTGTARIAGRGRYEAHVYNSSFAGYFPAEDPQYSCLVLVSEPKLSYYGSSVAAPVFREIARKVHAKAVRITLPDTIQWQAPKMLCGQAADVKAICKHFDLKTPDLDEMEWLRLNKVNTSYVASNTEQDGRMPDLLGSGLRDVLFRMENRDIKVRYTGLGMVVEQSPDPGTSLRPGQTIYVRLGHRS